MSLNRFMKQQHQQSQGREFKPVEPPREFKPVEPPREHPAVYLVRSNAFRQSKSDVRKLFLQDYEPPDIQPRCEKSEVSINEPEDFEDAMALVNWYARCTRRLGHAFLKKCFTAVGKRLIFVWRHYPSRGLSDGELVLPELTFDVAKQAIPIPIEAVSDENVARQQLVDLRRAVEGNRFMVYVSELCIEQVDDLYGV